MQAPPPIALESSAFTSDDLIKKADQTEDKGAVPLLGGRALAFLMHIRYGYINIDDSGNRLINRDESDNLKIHHMNYEEILARVYDIRKFTLPNLTKETTPPNDKPLDFNRLKNWLGEDYANILAQAYRLIFDEDLSNTPKNLTSNLTKNEKENIRKAVQLHKNIENDLKNINENHSSLNNQIKKFNEYMENRKSGGNHPKTTFLEESHEGMFSSLHFKNWMIQNLVETLQKQLKDQGITDTKEIKKIYAQHKKIIFPLMEAIITSIHPLWQDQSGYIPDLKEQQYKKRQQLANQWKKIKSDNPRFTLPSDFPIYNIYETILQLIKEYEEKESKRINKRNINKDTLFSPAASLQSKDEVTLYLDISDYDFNNILLAAAQSDTHPSTHLKYRNCYFTKASDEKFLFCVDDKGNLKKQPLPSNFKKVLLNHHGQKVIKLPLELIKTFKGENTILDKETINRINQHKVNSWTIVNTQVDFLSALNVKLEGKIKDHPSGPLQEMLDKITKFRKFTKRPIGDKPVGEFLLEIVIQSLLESKNEKNSIDERSFFKEIAQCIDYEQTFKNIKDAIQDTQFVIGPTLGNKIFKVNEVLVPPGIRSIWALSNSVEADRDNLLYEILSLSTDKNNEFLKNVFTRGQTTIDFYRNITKHIALKNIVELSELTNQFNVTLENFNSVSPSRK